VSTTRRAEDDTYAEYPKRIAEGGVTSRNAGLYFTAPQVAFKEGALGQLVEEIVNSSERPVGVANQMESMCMDDGGYNTHDKFRDGLTELLCHRVARISDLVANTNQYFLASFGQAQRCDTIRLERSAVSTRSAANVGPSHSPGPFQRRPRSSAGYSQRVVIQTQAPIARGRIR
jgi:putative hemolysin